MFEISEDKDGSRNTVSLHGAASTGSRSLEVFVSSSCTDTHTVCDSFLPLQQSEEVGRCRPMLNFANRPAQVVPAGPTSLWGTGCESAAPT